MNWEPISSPHLEIKEMKSTVNDSDVHVSWHWQNEIEFVYVYKTAADLLKPNHQILASELKLYTREEFKANQGLIFRLDKPGSIALRILPGKKVDNRLIIVNQEDERNLLYINGLKSRIYFSITYKQKLFQTRKKVKITIISELPIDKEQLVYVKKRGSIPLSVDDGTIYPFVRDFSSGKTVLPEIEINKHEFIQIFLSKGKQTAQIYELIPE
ncbi:hypothetical protein [Bacillus sp. USDA818B3_A]|uniref:hypothetical protein n=1 Tax=Bacillus sp. USDA818B3_A TaxID=2698834 RepID=UPI0013699E6B|nr:hypothetical protein [Bacillus sp. USDA818B3_A]